MKIMKDVLKDRNYTKRRCAGHNAWKCLPPVHHSLPPKGTAYPVQVQGMLRQRLLPAALPQEKSRCLGLRSIPRRRIQNPEASA